MDVLDEDQVVNVLMSLQSDGERTDYVGGIDNESLDFSQLEDFINDETGNGTSYFQDTLSHVDGGHLSTLPVNSVDHSNNRQISYHSHLPLPPANLILGKGEAVLVVSTNSYTTPISTASLDSASYPYVHSHHSLPESPPDSGSEPPYSPQDGIRRSPAIVANRPEVLLQPNAPNGVSANGLITLPYVRPIAHSSTTVQDSCSETILMQHPVTFSSITQLLQQQQTILPPPVSPGIITNQEGLESAITLNGSNLSNNKGSPHLVTSKNKKRKLSQDSSNVHVKQEPELSSDTASSHTRTLAPTPDVTNPASSNDDDYSFQEGNSNGSVTDSSIYLDNNSQYIRFQPFQQSSWHTLCDQNLQELPVPRYHVDADKGFNFSHADDAFVCQKKNHFQITCHAQLEGEAQFVKTNAGIRKISSFYLHFYGVKVESPTQTVKVEQSLSDRSKKAFHPVLIDLKSDKMTKITVGRLHFSETTSNNMRKKGKPNPDQRYFQLVVGLHAHCNNSSDYAIISYSSEKIIVRASNPGQFENDVELCWQRGSSPESVFHAGRVGINTDRPDEALAVHGNVKVTGHILKPSDNRIKTNIQPCNHREQLKNIQQLNVVRFTYTPEFSSQFGLLKAHDTGVIAQEVQKIIPEAVTATGSIVLANGTKFENFLLVDKERIYMENVGAVKELCKVTDNLETRIDELERMNRKLVRLRRHDSTKSSSSYSTVLSGKSKLTSYTETNLCSNYYIQAIIIILVFVIAVCLASIATLYFLEFRNSYNFAGVSSFLNNEKFGQIYNKWSINSSEISQIYDYDRNNVTDLKLALNTHHKLRTKDRQQPSPITEDGSGNGNQKLTKHKQKPSLQANSQHHLANIDKGRAQYGANDVLPISKVPALGRPAHCSSTLTYNSVLHYVDSPSPCQSFCCYPGIIHNSGDENDQSSQDTLKIKSFGENQMSTDFSANVAQMTPAANTLEDTQILSAIGYTSKDTISAFGQEQTFNNKKDSNLKPIAVNKNSIDLSSHRRKRYAIRVKDNDSNSEQYPTTNDSITIKVLGSNFNQTINSSYCNQDSANYIQCIQDTAANISYIIPLSKYLSDTHLYLIFQFSKSSKYQKVVSCSSGLQFTECPAKNHEIYWMNSEEVRVEQMEVLENYSKMGAHFHINISNSLVLMEKYRISVDTLVIDVCQAPSNKLGLTYLEYNIYFLRTCEE